MYKKFFQIAKLFGLKFKEAFSRKADLQKEWFSVSGKKASTVTCGRDGYCAEEGGSNNWRHLKR
jgi:hypothetical protein